MGTLGYGSDLLPVFTVTDCYIRMGIWVDGGGHVLGSRLSALRKTTGKTQEEMAAYLGISRPAYTAYERGRRQPDYAILQRIADYYHVSVDYLLGRPGACGKYIAKKRAEYGKSLDRLAEEAGVSPRLLDGVESGAIYPSDLSLQDLERIAEALKVSTIDLLLGRDSERHGMSTNETEWRVAGGEHDLPPIHESSTLSYGAKQPIHVPILSEVTAEHPAPMEQNIIGYELVGSDEAQEGNHFYLRVKGDAMIGSRIRDGDLVLVSQHDEVEDGAVGLVLLNADEAVLRRVYFHDGVIILQADNPMNSPMVCLAKDVELVGRVKHVKFWL